jgi:GNAT superfamily N-acetyltransferase
MTEHWHPVKLNDEHELGAFDCGVASLNHWLTAHARRAQAADTARTYVWANDDNTVVAYYSITPTQVLREELTGGLAGGFQVVPAYLLARLALDVSLHKRGFGADLLVDAVAAAVGAAETGGGRLIVVDAIDDTAARFYQHHDFKPVKGNPRRLVMKISTARRAMNMVSFRINGDPGLGLVSLSLVRPDGMVVPLVASNEEASTIANGIRDLIDQRRREGDAEIELTEILQIMFGRNVLTDPGQSRPD